MIAADTFFVACGQPQPSGDLIVVVETSAPDTSHMDPDGYTVTTGSIARTIRTVAGTACGYVPSAKPLYMCADSAQIRLLPAGNHEITLSGLARNCGLDPSVSQANPSTVTVQANDTTRQRFFVYCEHLDRWYDDDFEVGRAWSVIVLATGGNARQRVSIQCCSQGLDDHYRWMKHDQSQPGGIVVLHVYEHDTYDPRQLGTISTLDYSADERLISGDAVRTRFALVQGGVVFATAGTQLQQPAFGWHWTRLVGLTANDFSDIAGTGARPDFSYRGAEIQFGYIRSTVTADIYGGDVEHAIDAWAVLVRRVRNP
jgi:hypothetical protein